MHAKCYPKAQAKATICGYEKMLMKQRCLGEIQEWSDLPENLCLHPKSFHLKGQKTFLRKMDLQKQNSFRGHVNATGDFVWNTSEYHADRVAPKT